MLHASFLNGFFLDRKDSRAYLVSEDLEESHGVLDALEVGWDLEPTAEAVPFPPVRGVLVNLGIGEVLSESRVCSIVRSRCFVADDRRHSLHG